MQEFKNENLLQTFPKNYKLAYKNENKQTHIDMYEFIPKNETLEDWSKMITTNIFHRNLNISPQEYVKVIKAKWEESCEEGYTKLLPHGKENGYEYALVMLYCKKSNQIKKEQLTYLKAIKGNDSFYVVQKAFTFLIEKNQIIDTMRYLKRIGVCDTRLKNCTISK
jgi:hypothetical protein